MNRRCAMQRELLILLLFGVLVASGPSLADEATPTNGLLVREQVIVDKEAWTWNWSSWDQEKIVTFGSYEYTPYWDADRVFVLARRDLRTNEVQTLRIPAFKLSADDRHRNTCLGVSAADGRLHLSWDHHGDQLHYARSRAGFLTDPPAKLSPDDIGPAQPMLSDPKLEARVTYPRFLNDRDGNLYCFYRVGGSGNGDNYLQRYNPADGTWKRIGHVFSSRGAYGPWEESDSRCAYLHDLLFDSRNRLHASWVYRETGATWASNHDLHYAYSDDGGVTWYNNSGQKTADLSKDDPIELSDPGIVVREIPVYSWVMNAGCLALDSKNRPHVVTFTLPGTARPEKLEHAPPDEIRKQLCFVHYWRAEDGEWRGGEPIAPGDLGVSRVDLVFDRQDNLYFYYPTEKGLRYFTARASDEWEKWSGPLQLTTEEVSGRDASKHDRGRWIEKGILTFTARVGEKGFAILDVAPPP